MKFSHHMVAYENEQSARPKVACRSGCGHVEYDAEPRELRGATREDLRAKRVLDRMASRIPGVRVVHVG